MTVEVDILGSPSLISLVFEDVKKHERSDSLKTTLRKKKIKTDSKFKALDYDIHASSNHCHTCLCHRSRKTIS